MLRTRPLWFVAVLTLALLAGPALGAVCKAPTRKATARKVVAKRKAARIQKLGIDPQAKELLRKMSDYLSSLDRFKVRTEVTQEVVLPSGEPLDSDRATDLMVERPNHLRADLASGMRNIQVFYNGDKVTLYTPKLNVYGQWQAPPTVSGLLTVAAKDYGLSFPASDFLSASPYDTMMRKVKSGGYVGKSLIRGVMTDHLAFRQKDLDWQVWIAEGDKPLPVRLAITDRAVKGAPRYMVTLTEWDTAPQFDPAAFTFTPPEDAKQIAVLSVAQIRQRAAELRAQRRVARR